MTSRVRSLEASPAAGPIGSLVLSAWEVASWTPVERAIGWWNELARLGVQAPLFVVYDLGIIYGAPADARRPRAAGAALGRRATRRLNNAVVAYRALVAAVAAADEAVRADRPPLRDDAVVIVLARLLEPSPQAPRPPSPWREPIAGAPEIVPDLDARLRTLFDAVSRDYEAAWLDAFIGDRLRVLTRADALDVESLRAWGLFGGRSGESPFGGALGYVDALAALSHPAADRVVGFSLELLPRVLERSRPRGYGTHAVDGYGGIGAQGTTDSIVLTELAWDDAEFDRRLVDRELLFFTREQEPQPASRLHHILVDASASMRGDREVFARGIALATAKRLELRGEEARTRFFDARLYGAQRPRGRGPAPAAWVLAFQGERGRNPARVFAQLATELAILRAHDPRELVVHVITHAALHVPRELVAEVRRYARVFCVFILPSQASLDLEWLDLVEHYAVVDQAALRPGAERVRVGARIVDRLTK